MNLGEEAADPKEVVKTWFERCRTSQHAHYASVTRYIRVNSVLTWTSTVLSAVVGSTVFAVLAKDVRPWLRFLVGFLSVCTAVVVALKGTLHFEERAEQHRVAASAFGDIRRELELLYAQTASLPSETMVEKLDSIRSNLHSLTTGAPPIPTRLFRKIRSEITPATR
jgi:hypothetical protein